METILLTDEKGIYVGSWHKRESAGTKISTNKGDFVVLSVEHHRGGTILICRKA